jgi:hypothetical protein
LPVTVSVVSAFAKPIANAALSALTASAAVGSNFFMVKVKILVSLTKPRLNKAVRFTVTSDWLNAGILIFPSILTTFGLSEFHDMLVAFAPWVARIRSWVTDSAVSLFTYPISNESLSSNTAC